MLNASDIKKVFDCLYELNLGYRFGYAGSYAKGQAQENSDLDILVKGQEALSSNAYFTIYHTLKNILPVHFDIVDLTALEEDDLIIDKKLLEMGLAINTESAYKTMKNDVIWMNGQ